MIFTEGWVCPATSVAATKQVVNPAKENPLIAAQIANRPSEAAAIVNAR
jgi:hypothetical protein